MVVIVMIMHTKHPGIVNALASRVIVAMIDINSIKKDIRLAHQKHHIKC